MNVDPYIVGCLIGFGYYLPTSPKQGEAGLRVIVALILGVIWPFSLGFELRRLADKCLNP